MRSWLQVRKLAQMRYVHDDHRLLGHLRRIDDQAEALRRATLEAQSEGVELSIRVDPRAAPNDPAALRGVPVVGGRGSLGGAIRGTRPGDGLE